MDLDVKCVVKAAMLSWARKITVWRHHRRSLCENPHSPDKPHSSQHLWPTCSHTWNANPLPFFWFQSRSQIAKKSPMGWLPIPSKPLFYSWCLCVWCGTEETVWPTTHEDAGCPDRPWQNKPFSDTSCKWQLRGFRDSLILPLWGAMRWCEDIQGRWSGETPKSKNLFSPLLLGLKVPGLLAVSHPASWLHSKMEREMDRPGHLNFRTPAMEILPLKQPLYGLHTHQAPI